MADSRRKKRRLAGVINARLPEVGFEAIADPRARRGRRWRLATLLKTCVVGIMSGCNSIRDVELVTADMAPQARRLLGIRGRIADTTLRDVLVRMDPHALRGGIVRQVRAAHRRKALKPQGLPFGIASVDGKNLTIDAWGKYAQRKRSADGMSATGHLRTMTTVLSSSSAKVCLDANPIPAAINEMSHFPAALDALDDAYGSLALFKLVATDAGMCSEANAAHTLKRGYHYLFALKETQPTLRAEAQRLLCQRTAVVAAETEDVVGSAFVTRRLYTAEMAGFHWSHVKTVLRIETVTTSRKDGSISTNNRYYLSSLARDALTSQQWLRVIRERWSVENQGHCTFDKILREDDHPWITAGDDAPLGALAVLLLRRIAYNAMTLYRSVTQRAEDNRQIPWRLLIRAIYNTLIAVAEPDLAGLRPRAAVFR